MEDETTGLDNPKGGTEVDTSQGGTGADAPNLSALEKLQAQLEEERRKTAAAHLEAKKTREKMAERDKAILLENEEYKRLYETGEEKIASLETRAAKAERYEAALMATNEQRIASLPEEYHDKFNKLSAKMSPDELSDTLDDFAPVLMRRPIPNLNSGAGGAGGHPPKPDVEITQADKDAAYIAAQHGRNISAESLARRRAAKKQT